MEINERFRKFSCMRVLVQSYIHSSQINYYGRGSDSLVVTVRDGMLYTYESFLGLGNRTSDSKNSSKPTTRIINCSPCLQQKSMLMYASPDSL